MIILPLEIEEGVLFYLKGQMLRMYVTFALWLEIYALLHISSLPCLTSFVFFFLLLKHEDRRALERLDSPVGRHPEFRYKTEFQSHEPEVLTGCLLMRSECFGLLES